MMTVGAQIARLHIAMLNIVDAVIADPEHRQSVRKLVNTEFSRYGKDEKEPANG